MVPHKPLESRQNLNEASGDPTRGRYMIRSFMSLKLIAHACLAPAFVGGQHNLYCQPSESDFIYPSLWGFRSNALIPSSSVAHPVTLTGVDEGSSRLNRSCPYVVFPGLPSPFLLWRNVFTVSCVILSSLYCAAAIFSISPSVPPSEYPV